MSAVGMVLLTASLGGTFTRGESLLSWLPVSFDSVPLMPLWLSAGLIVAALANMGLMRRQDAA
jgi:hypothetical protein